MKFIIQLVFVNLLLFSAFVSNAQTERDVLKRADQLTNWMVENLDLNQKQFLAVQEINYEIAHLELLGAEGEDSESKEADNLNKLKAVLSEQQLDAYQKAKSEGVDR